MLDFSLRPALRFALGLLFGVWALPVCAQTVPATPREVTANAVDKLAAGVREKLASGQQLLEANDPRAAGVLREAAQGALKALAAPGDPLRLAHASLPADALTLQLATLAADAHLQWGLAADRFARRDESIAALSRALRLVRALPTPPANLERDISLGLSRVLRLGLPLVAPDDVLETIASEAHAGLWTPLLSGFDQSHISAQIGGADLPTKQFLITDGKLFPPVNENTTVARLVQIAPPYREVALNRLPPALQLDKMVAGYEKQDDGAAKNQWRQIVRVFYASPFLTKDRRDDLPRARSLVASFLRVHSLFAQQLGASNFYARGEKSEGVTILWLLETSALWPNDDDDPAVLAQMGPRMPAINIGARLPAEVKTTALTRPWNTPIAGQYPQFPGEILFWKAALERPEAEWLREVAHEYGHVALPAFAGFRPPLEPFGNGKLGETLGMLWAAQNPASFAPADANTAQARDFAAQVRAHVADEAFPAWKRFVGAAATPPAQVGNSDDLRLLCGAAVFLERVYGAKLLGRAWAPFLSGDPDASLMARRLTDSTRRVMDAPNSAWKNVLLNSKTLPIWLPGALNLDRPLDDFIARRALNLPANTRVAGWLWVPPGADSLLIEGAHADAISGLGWPFKAGKNSVRLFFAGKNGWQKIALATNRAATIESARLERE